MAESESELNMDLANLHQKQQMQLSKVMGDKSRVKDLQGKVNAKNAALNKAMHFRDTTLPGLTACDDNVQSSLRAIGAAVRQGVDDNAVRLGVLAINNDNADNIAAARKACQDIIDRINSDLKSLNPQLKSAQDDLKTDSSSLEDTKDSINDKEGKVSDLRAQS